MPRPRPSLPARRRTAGALDPHTVDAGQNTHHRVEIMPSPLSEHQYRYRGHVEASISSSPGRSVGSHVHQAWSIPASLSCDQRGARSSSMSRLAAGRGRARRLPNRLLIDQGAPSTAQRMASGRRWRAVLGRLTASRCPAPQSGGRPAITRAPVARTGASTATAARRSVNSVPHGDPTLR